MEKPQQQKQIKQLNQTQASTTIPRSPIRCSNHKLHLKHKINLKSQGSTSQADEIQKLFTQEYSITAYKGKIKQQSIKFQLNLLKREQLRTQQHQIQYHTEAQKSCSGNTGRGFGNRNRLIEELIPGFRTIDRPGSWDFERGVGTNKMVGRGRERGRERERDGEEEDESLTPKLLNDYSG